jgi:hypothetical protein
MTKTSVTPRFLTGQDIEPVLIGLATAVCLARSPGCLVVRNGLTGLPDIVGRCFSRAIATRTPQWTSRAKAAWVVPSCRRPCPLEIGNRTRPGVRGVRWPGLTNE